MSIIAFPLLATFFSCAALAQNGSTKITVFQPGGVKQEDVPKPPPNTNLIKWNYCLLSRGAFVMNYEFVASTKLNVELGAGLTYRDFIYEVMQNEVFLEYSNANVNMAGEAALRFYPKGSDNFEGIYLSPAISYRKYSFDPQRDLYGGSNYSGFDPLFTPSYSFVDAQFKFGYQYESYWVDDIITDFYIGFGLRNATARYYELYDTPTPFGGYTTEIRKTTMTDSYPQPLFGFKLGVSF